MKEERILKEENLKRNKFQEVIKSELVKDKLVDGTAYEYRLTAKKLFINGKKQSKKIFNKYSGLHKENNIKLDKNGEYQFSGNWEHFTKLILLICITTKVNSLLVSDHICHPW